MIFHLFTKLLRNSYLQSFLQVMSFLDQRCPGIKPSEVCMIGTILLLVSEYIGIDFDEGNFE